MFGFDKIIRNKRRGSPSRDISQATEITLHQQRLQDKYHLLQLLVDLNVKAARFQVHHAWTYYVTSLIY